MNAILLALAVAVSVGGGGSQELTALPRWQGEDMVKWVKGTHQIGEVRCERGVLTGTATGTDPFWTAGVKPFRPTATQEVVFWAKSPVGGSGQVYWAPVGAPRPTAKTGAWFTWIGDGRWHEYRVRPFWQGGGDIRLVRVDFPNDAMGKGEIGLKDVRIVDEQKVGVVSRGPVAGIAFTCRAATGGKGVFEWAAEKTPGLQKTAFPLAADGRPHRYYLPLAKAKGNIVWHRFVRSKEQGELAVEDFRFCAKAPALPADLFLIGANFVSAACRVGTEGRIEAVVRNLGTAAATGVTLRATDVPAGLTVMGGEALTVAGGECALLFIKVKSERPFAGTVQVQVSWTGADGAHGAVAQGVSVKVLPGLGLPKCAYVPEPTPPKCAYTLGALYYPGWERSEAWKRVWKTCPERRPLLGWYDETRTEVVDWQIKWLAENGIRELYVDWYWHKGHRHHEHWIHAFQQARWRKYLKWAVMWANHTPAGAHSEKDQREVTQFWIDHYFNTPEYITRDGKPVVWIWAPRNLDRDLGAGGCRKLLDLSRQMAVAAGYKGIHFIAMKWPEAECSAKVLQGYKDQGFDEVGIYHFMSPAEKPANPHRYAYADVAKANPANWRGQLEANVMPFLPNLSTGWDDRPWNDHCEVYGKNAADFRRICQEAKRFADETGIKRLCLAPINEWGEGSYAEPNAEHGFGFYEAVRETFCERPEGGWQPNIVPEDVGLGPYDLPLPSQAKAKR